MSKLSPPVIALLGLLVIIFISLVSYFLFFAPHAFASTPPNSPRQTAPSHNSSWSDSSAVPPGSVNFTWQNNGDAESNPLWFYFYLIKWTGTTWQIHTSAYASAQGKTDFTISSLPEGDYAWQVAAVDASQSSTPFYSWADRNSDSTITSADWSQLRVKIVTVASCDTGGRDVPCIPTSFIKTVCPPGSSPMCDFITIQSAIDASTVGWTIQIKNGVYNEKIRIGNDPIDDQTYTLNNATYKNCSKINPCTLMAYPGHSPIIDITGVAGSPNIGIFLKSSWWIIDGMEVKGGGAGVRIDRPNVNFRNNYLHDNAKTGFIGALSISSTHDINVVNNRIDRTSYNIGECTDASVSEPWHCHSIYLTTQKPSAGQTCYPTRAITISKNILSNAPGSAVQTSSNGCPFPNDHEDILIENNLMIDTSHGINFLGYNKNNIVRNNTFIAGNPPPSTDSKSQNAFLHFSGNSTGNIIVNNIFYAKNNSVRGFSADPSTTVSGNTIDYNSYNVPSNDWIWQGYTPRNDFATAFRSMITAAGVIGAEANALFPTSNPLFQNLSASNFHLTSASPPKDTGTNTQCALVDKDGNARPYPIGGICDIGAYEYKP